MLLSQYYSQCTSGAWLEESNRKVLSLTLDHIIITQTLKTGYLKAHPKAKAPVWKQVMTFSPAASLQQTGIRNVYSSDF